MKALPLVGILLVVLGIASLFLQVPHTEKQGIKAGGITLGLEISHNERVSPIISGVLIAGGIALGIASMRTRVSNN
jgi:uncharacterized membrane protein